MTIELELDPRMEAHLVADAAQHGLAPERYAQRLLQNAISARMRTIRKPSQQEIQSFLDAFASKEPTPETLRHETFSREMIYGEHD